MIALAVWGVIAALSAALVLIIWIECSETDRERRRRQANSYQTADEGVDCLHCRSAICERWGCQIDRL